MAGVFIDPDGVRGLAKALRHAADDLAADLHDARRQDVSHLTAPIGNVIAWAEEQARELRTAADTAELLAHRRPAWARTAIADCDLPALASGVSKAHHAALLADLKALIGSAEDKPLLERTRLVAHWFAQLSTAEQAALTDRSPDVIGRLDGIPFAVRDVANRIRYQRIRGQYAFLLESEGWWDDVLAGRRELLTRGDAGDMADTIRAIDAVLARPDRYLLDIDLSMGEQAKIVLAIGDPDTADHVGVFTPGFTTTVKGSLLNYETKLTLLRQEALWLANGESPGTGVSTIFWLGYRAPQTSDMLNPLQSVLTPYAADRGSKDLSSFLAGIDGVRVEGVNITALGHSYGSVTTGLALKRARTGVDSAVVWGSPGIGVDKATELRLPNDRVYFLEARKDFVADAGSFGPDVSSIAGLKQLSTEPTIGPSGKQTMSESTGHSGYLDDNSTSQYNIASILVDREGSAITADTSGAGDSVRKVVGHIPLLASVDLDVYSSLTPDWIGRPSDAEK